MQLHAKFFGKKAEALGVSYYHTIALHSESDSFEDVRKAIYLCGYESVTVLDVSISTDRVLTSDEKIYNSAPGLVRAPHV